MEHYAIQTEWNAIDIFSWMMPKVFKDWNNQFLKVFVDDVNIHNLNWKDHLQHIWLVFQRLREVHLKQNLNKCCFCKKILFSYRIKYSLISLNLN
jgi:hypothetical protein